MHGYNPRCSLLQHSLATVVSGCTSPSKGRTQASFPVPTPIVKIPTSSADKFVGCKLNATGSGCPMTGRLATSIYTIAVWCHASPTLVSATSYRTSGDRQSVRNSLTRQKTKAGLQSASFLDCFLANRASRYHNVPVFTENQGRILA